MKHLKRFNENSSEKLPYDKWESKFFTKCRGNRCESRYEIEILGFAPSDLSLYKKKELEEIYQGYLNDSLEDSEELEFYNEY